MQPARPGWLGRLDRSMTATPVRLHAGGNTRIAAGTLVVSAGPELAPELRDLWRHLSPESPATLLLTATRPVYESVGAKPLLLRDARYTGNWPDLPRDPLSIFAWKGDCTRFLIAVDGRQPGSAGVDGRQAANLAADLGATTAYGLDGGGSTTLVGPDGELLNHPSDLTSTGERVERPVADSLLVLPAPPTSR